MLLQAKQSTERQLIEAEATPGPDHPAVLRLAGIECQLWRALLGRLAVVAGEVD